MIGSLSRMRRDREPLRHEPASQMDACGSENGSSSRPSIAPEVMDRLKRVLVTRLADEQGQALRRSHSTIRHEMERDEQGGMADVQQRLADSLTALCDEYQIHLDSESRQQLLDTLTNDLCGFGPLTKLMSDESVSDILVNGAGQIWADRAGSLDPTELAFDDEAHLQRFVSRLIAPLGKHLDASSPIVDARLADGSRLHAVCAPLTPDGTLVSIRKFRRHYLDRQRLVAAGFMSDSLVQLLGAAVAARVNILISGGAGVGKTSLLNYLAGHISHGERLVSVEECAELDLHHPHVVRLESYPVAGDSPRPQGLGELLRAALRMRADRIIVGEARGGEVFEMLQAMTVGHDGSLTTLHANSALDVPVRMLSLALMSSAHPDRQVIEEMVRLSGALIVHLERDAEGHRQLASLAWLGEERPRELLHRRSTTAPGEPCSEEAYQANPDVLHAFIAHLEARGATLAPGVRDGWCEGVSRQEG